MSTSAPRPTSIFEPSSPQQLTDDQNTESSPQNSLPCGQRMPAGSTSTSDTPSPHTPTHYTSPKPHKPQNIPHSPIKTNVNPSSQPPIADEEQQHVAKSTNGSQVKHSKQQPRQQEECLLFPLQPTGSLEEKLS